MAHAITNCAFCGEYIDERQIVQDYRGKRIGLCSDSECNAQFQDEDKDSYERELEQAHRDVDDAFGRWR